MMVAMLLVVMMVAMVAMVLVVMELLKPMRRMRTCTDTASMTGKDFFHHPPTPTPEYTTVWYRINMTKVDLGKVNH